MEKRVPAGDLVKAKGLSAADVIAIKTTDKTLGKKGVVDLFTPVPENAEFSVIKETDAEGLEVIRHSTAHVMADAVQRLFPGTKVTIGPAIEDGFYYDFDKAGGGSFSEEDLAKIEATIKEIVSKKTPFRREVVSRNDALSLFERMGETFKVELIKAIPEGEEISLYKHGPAGTKEEWVDVCEGPHVPSTDKLGAVKLTSVAGAYWRGDERNPMLQRIYGTAFATQAALDEHLKLIEEAKARDHRKLGKELDLFFFDQVSPAMPFLLPRGAFVYNRLNQYLRDLYVHYGYEEVITPQAFDPKLFRTSGHLGNYNENMYRLWTEDVVEEALAAKDATAQSLAKSLQEQSFALKPMNCPSHCVIFGSRKRSYRELPWRVADFGRLHRYERGGVVHGLSRVRTFCQDDAHIFCTREQVPEEIEKFLKMFYAIYKAFDLTKIDIRLATRPDKRIGADEEWDMSEKALEEGLNRAGLPFTFSPGEGAFYGPKLEFHVQDALKRSWQLGTMQYDPNLPERFELDYTGQDGKNHRPVMLHRAIFGTFERFLSVYLEHIAGNFPTWLAPTQAMILTVSDKSEAYGRSVMEEMKQKGLRVDADFSGDKLGAKIKNARTMRYPYMVIVGPKDAEAGSVSVRAGNTDLGAMPRAAFIEKVLAENAPPLSV